MIIVNKNELTIIHDKLPISVNNAYYTDRNTYSRHYTAAARKYKKRLLDMLVEKGIKQNHFPDDAIFSFWIRFQLTDKMAKRIDLNNFTKLPMDIFFGGNDCYFHKSNGEPYDDNSMVIIREGSERVRAEINSTVIIIKVVNYPATRAEFQSKEMIAK